ncbi:hypothetical protein CL651_004475 [bacterium]|nr:hypothetical protein [bacterium]|tara:strand:+ start:10507 stop:11163 length:657 start_codon:yes stop_codon:yes gene_type:complete
MNKPNIDLIIDRIYQEKRLEITRKIESFSLTNLNNYKDIFLELIFVILAAGTSAKLALKTTEILKKKDFIFHSNMNEIILKLKGCYRFYNVRGRYIYTTRSYIKESYDNNFNKIFANNSGHYDRRNFFYSNKMIQGVGMKASSHFLRNIGFHDYAILDKHIINLLKECGIISTDIKVLNEKNYLRIEKILREIGARHNLNLSSLDLVMWYFKTGEIIK